jgi:ribokinase
MAIFTLGSINIDHVYLVPHLAHAGETIAATGYSKGIGGKGANQSVAAAKAGANVSLIGATGPDAAWVLDELQGYGVDISRVAEISTPTGHAIIQVDPQAENSIVLFSGANRQISDHHATGALSSARPGDVLLVQNETSAQTVSLELASRMGLHVLYTPAPFELAALKAAIPFATLLLMNEGEAAEMTSALGSLPECDVIITKGAKGAEWHSPNATPRRVPSFKVTAVDTTGAGDCFAGTIAAALDAGLPPEKALRRASAAAALQVTRPGAAAAMPTAAEVDAFLATAP